MDNSFEDKKPNNNSLLHKLILMVEEIREQNKIIIEELSYIKKDKVIDNKSKGWFY